jgi:hypothetical protein
MYKIIRIDRNNLDKFPQNEYDLTDIDNPILISEAPIQYELIAQNRLNTDDFVVIVTGKGTNKYSLTEEEKSIFDSLKLDYINTNIIPDNFNQTFVHGNWGNITDLKQLLKIKVRETIENRLGKYDLYDQIADTDKVIGQINAMLMFMLPQMFEHMIKQDEAINQLKTIISANIEDVNILSEVDDRVYTRENNYVSRYKQLLQMYIEGKLKDTSWILEEGATQEISILMRKTTMADIIKNEYVNIYKELGL